VNSLQLWLSITFIAAGAAFFFAGSIGLLRFPDVYARLHALTKADNLGLGLIVAGLILRHAQLALALKLLLIWMLVILSSATTCNLIANLALRTGLLPDTGDGNK
jgi:multicomponent Na+:H+ antiporter subunit G